MDPGKKKKLEREARGQRREDFERAVAKAQTPVPKLTFERLEQMITIDRAETAADAHKCLVYFLSGRDKDLSALCVCLIRACGYERELTFAPDSPEKSAFVNAVLARSRELDLGSRSVDRAARALEIIAQMRNDYAQRYARIEIDLTPGLVGVRK